VYLVEGRKSKIAPPLARTPFPLPISLAVPPSSIYLSTYITLHLYPSTTLFHTSPYDIEAISKDSRQGQRSIAQSPRFPLFRGYSDPLTP
jgi:hypothetical protein